MFKRTVICHVIGNTWIKESQINTSTQVLKTNLVKLSKYLVYGKA